MLNASFGITFQSTLSMRRATQSAQMASDLTLFQSTLSMRRATSNGLTYHLTSIFQSTLSMRRATQCQRRTVIHGHISIHALHEESDGVRVHIVACLNISIHALHEESDHRRYRAEYRAGFQSTLSMRRATNTPVNSSRK